MLRLLLVVIAIILYGSLFPLRFAASGDAADALNALINGWPRRISRGDAVANVLLYIPFGFALAGVLRQAWAGRAGTLAALMAAAIGGAMLSAAIEMTQFFIPVRTTSLSDLAFNIAGTAIGAGLAVLMPRAGLQSRPPVRDIFALLLALAWAADRLWPLVPALDLSNIKDALKPLLAGFSASPLVILRLTLGWFLFATLAEAALGRARLVQAAIILAGSAIACAPPFLLGRVLSVDGLLGAALGLILWRLARNAPAGLSRLLPMLAALALVTIIGLAPYTFLASPRGFTLVPFTDLARGTRGAAAEAMVLKAFLFGTLVWSYRRAGMPLALVALFAPLTLLAISVAQMWLPGRSASTTDAAIAAVMVLALLALKPAERPPAAHEEPWHGRP
jgi:VanZ family protein